MNYLLELDLIELRDKLNKESEELYQYASCIDDSAEERAEIAHAKSLKRYAIKIDEIIYSHKNILNK
jgi:hypothetical protein